MCFQKKKKKDFLCIHLIKSKIELFFTKKNNIKRNRVNNRLRVP